MPPRLLKIKKLSVYLIILIGTFSCSNEGSDLASYRTPYEISDGKATTTYEQGIDWWKALESRSPYLKVIEFGDTDAGKPLHLIILNKERNFSLEKLHTDNKLILLVNNGIHPGEPDGIDASMIFTRELLSNADVKNKLDDIILAIIPFYNVGGAMNRNCCSRANQNGPESYGFRGNSRNLDLNRDFIKCDSRNAQSFNQIFSSLDPDIYLETHVTNGADYPYTMTYLVSQPDKLGKHLGTTVRDELSPLLFDMMKKKEDEMIPYVNVHGGSPEHGFSAFYDSPRYSTGYTALHHSIGMLTETHMLKPFDQRVESTKRFLESLLDASAQLKDHIIAAREEQLKTDRALGEMHIDWELDSSLVEELVFKGYQAYKDTSSVTGQPQLYYNRDSIWTKPIPYYNVMKPKTTVSVPSYYLVPRAWSEVIDRLTWNGVKMKPLEHDTTMDVVAYEILETQTPKNPYEGHYIHRNTSVEKQYWSHTILGGTHYLIDTEQDKKRFILETLEPEAPDSYFNWNFFDEVLMQKEWFSSYIFDREAEKLLESDSALARTFEEMKAKDSIFANDAFSQLYFLYRNSDHYERNRHNIYPILRIE